jgi:hypothetical protein
MDMCKRIKLPNSCKKHPARSPVAELSYLRLQSRHIQLIAIGGTIDTSLFLGIGAALTKAGPLSLLLGFSITGVAIWGVVSVSKSRMENGTELVGRCNALGKWQHGFPFREQYPSSAADILTTLSASQLDGTTGTFVLLSSVLKLMLPQSSLGTGKEQEISMFVSFLNKLI